MGTKFHHEELLRNLGLIPSQKSCVQSKLLTKLDTSYDETSNFNTSQIQKSTHTPKKLFCMTIDLPDMTIDKIILFENDDPLQVAKEFCMKHGLNQMHFGIISETLIINSRNIKKNENNLGEVNNNPGNIEQDEITPTKKFFSLGEREEESPETPSIDNEENIRNVEGPFSSLTQNFEQLNDIKNNLLETNPYTFGYNLRDNQSSLSIFDRLHADPNNLEIQARNKDIRINELKGQNYLLESKTANNNKSPLGKPNYTQTAELRLLLLKGVTRKCLELYNQARYKQQKLQQKGISNGFLNGINRKLTQETRLEKENQENENCTFRPKINPKSEKLASRSKLANRIEQQIQTNTESNIETLIDPRLNNLNRLSYREDISRCNNDKKKSMIANIFEKLYNEHRISCQKKLIDKIRYNTEYSFIPETNGYLPRNGNIPFLERVEQYLESRKKREINETKENIENQEPTFKPQIIRGPKCSRNVENLPIGEYLYQNRIDIEYHKKELREKNKQEFEEKRAKSNEKSKVLVGNIKKNKILEIFNSMDSDQDGIITPQKIELNTLSTEVLEAFSPLLIEMDQLNAELDFDGFYYAAEQLIQTLDPLSKEKIFYNFHSKWQKNINNKENEFNFKPKINKNSAVLIENNGIYNKGGIYERQKAKQEKIKKMNS